MNVCLMNECITNVFMYECVTLSDGDGHQDHLLPVCLDAACQSSAVYVSGQRNKEVGAWGRPA